MKDPQVSIIIPAYNEVVSLPPLIRSIRNRSAGYVHEIIVADGGSTDGTREAVSSEGVKVIRCKMRGRAAQMNEGAAKATGSHLYFLHADTIPPHHFDQFIVRSVADGFSSGSFRLRFDDPHPLLRIYAWFTRFSWKLFRFGDQSLFTDRLLFEKVGGFDEELLVMEDQKIVGDLRSEAPFALMEESVVTSARKYHDNGVIRLQLIFTLIVIFYYAGAGQELLADLYNRLIRNDWR